MQSKRLDPFYLAITVAIATLVFAVGVTMTNARLEAKIEKYKTQLDQKDSQIFERQLKYEEEKSIGERLGTELEDAQDRLAAAEAREKAARARASRSRSFGGSRASEPRVGAPTVGSVLRGPLHDITMYCPTGNTTASGKWPRRGMVATMSRSIPFGSRVLIDGLGEFVVEDRIGHGSEFDIFTPSCSEADRFGRQHRRVTILDTDS